MVTTFPVLGGFTKLDFTPGGGATRGMVASMSDMANSRYMATPGSGHYQVQELANMGVLEMRRLLLVQSSDFVIKSGSDNVFLLVCVTSLKSHGDCAELGKLITLFIHVLGWIRPISTLWEIGERGAGV
jgi:hypothetical protein